MTNETPSGKAGAVQSAPRLICIAADFNKFDEHAVNQMSRNITLIRYKRFGDDLLLLEQLTEATSAAPSQTIDQQNTTPRAAKYKTISESMEDVGSDLANLFSDLDNYLLGLGDDVTKKTLRFYFAYRRMKNFACVEVRTSLNVLRMFLKVDPDTVELEDGFTRDVRHVGHFGTGDLEVTVRNQKDFERVKPLIQQSYEAS